MKKLCFACLYGLPLFFSATLYAQPANNECANATVLDDVTNFCTATSAFTTIGATQSSLAAPSCFVGDFSDVWFSFTAVANTVGITVVGNTSGNVPPGGSLVEPQVAVYSGGCAALVQEGCASDGLSENIVETFSGPLIIGQTYYIRVAARAEQQGTFQLCVNNYNAVPNPGSDCPDGIILCDKSAFSVEFHTGEGNDPNEITGSGCNGPSCTFNELNSAWYKWTCKEAGTLTFTLTPNNPVDDLDFMLFELPNGIDDCSDKDEVRCMASGENQSEPYSNWAICVGPTGLSLSESDVNESCGCPEGNNSFVAALDMEVGKSYALIINIFTPTGNGYAIEFGGTGTFLGPTAAFSYSNGSDTVCLNNPITFNDSSTSVEGISDWTWSFGLGATPATATGEGPHEVTYSTPGIKSIALTITSEAGCAVTTVQTLEVLPLPEVEPVVIADYCEPTNATGSITLTPIGPGQPYQYDFQNTGIFSPNNSFENLQTGTYGVVVRDVNGCQLPLEFEVPEGLSLAASVNPVSPPTCNGDSNGSISITIEVSNPPVQFDFGSGLQFSNTLSGIPAGTYNVYAVDAVGCEGFFQILVEDFPVLEPNVSKIDISCFEANDGSATAAPIGGAGGYTYLWSNGATTATIENLTEGPYSVTVTDANGCTATASVDIIEPDELTATVLTTDVICFGDATGVIAITATGGTPPLEYSSDGILFQSEDELTGLMAGIYEVTVRDSRGCTFVIETEITEPPAIVVEAGADQTIDLGFTAGLNAIVLPPLYPVMLNWTPPATLSCTDCLDPTAFPFVTTTYYLTAVDSTNCSGTDSVTVFVILNRPIYIPNAFSPNGDGLNDFFTVYGGRAAQSIRTFKVFNRWGGLVFEGNDLPLNTEPAGWNGVFKGKEMDPDVFAYFAEVEFIDGVVLLFEGGVHLIR